METNSSAGGEGTLVFVLRVGFRAVLTAETLLATAARFEVFLEDAFFRAARLAFFAGRLARLAITFFAVFRFAFLTIVTSGLPGNDGTPDRIGRKRRSSGNGRVFESRRRHHSQSPVHRGSPGLSDIRKCNEMGPWSYFRAPRLQLGYVVHNPSLIDVYLQRVRKGL